MPKHSLRPLLAPNAVAVIGGSDRAGSVGNVVLNNLLVQRFAHAIYAVNTHPVVIPGVTFVSRIEDLPADLDLAVVATPAETVPDVVARLGAEGVKVAVVLSGGVTGDLREAMLEAARPHGLRIVGPNGIGFLAPHAALNASFTRGNAKPGRLAFLSQSGALISSVLAWADERDIGFSGVVSLGDMADADLADMIDLFAADPHTDAILMYVEGVGDAAAFLSAARAAARSKPVIAVKAGRSAVGRSAALSHTGALAGAYEVHACAFERAGVVMVDSLEALFEAASVLCAIRPSAGDRLAIVTNGGGAGVLAADGLESIGARIAPLSPSTLAKLDAVLPPHWSHADPIDVLGDAGPDQYAAAVEAAFDDANVDALLVAHCATALCSPVEVAETVVRVVADRRRRGVVKPVIACWMGERDHKVVNAAFAGASIPVFETPSAAVKGFGHLLAAARARAALAAAPTRRTDVSADPAAARAIFALARAEGRTLLHEIEAKAVLTAYGVPVAPTILATTIDEVDAACRTLAPPYVLKVVSRDITHKSDVGGVALNLPTIGATVTAAREMRARLAQTRPDAEITGFAVETMAPSGGHELIVGLSRDPVFGPVVLFGAGGKAVEVLDDKALGLPPLTDDLSHAMIARTRVSRLLGGYRDEPAADLTAIAGVLDAISAMAVDLPDIVELDVNPLRADPRGVLALDARIVVTAQQAVESPLVIAPPPSGWDVLARTQGGLDVRMRPATPDDHADLSAFFARLSAEDLRHRFLTSLKTVDAERLALMTQNDFRRAITFLSCDGADGSILAAAMLAGGPDTERAEVAVSVRSDLKGMGLSWSLLEHTLAYARAVGVKVVESIEAADNLAALDLEREMGFTVRSLPDDHGLRLAERALDAPVG